MSDWLGIVITLIIIILLISGGAFAYLKYWPKSTSYFVDRAIGENNASICLEIEIKPSIDKYPMDCWRGIAQKNKDITICQTLEEEIEVNNCYTGFIHIRWNSYQEVLCDNLITLRDKNYCYMVTAIAKNDPSFCENIDTSEFVTEIEDCKSNVVQQNN